MPAKPEKKEEPKFKPISEPENWESGRKVSQASYLQRNDGTQAISFKMGTKNQYMKNPRWGKTIWIDEELDLPSWLNWFIKTLKAGYFKLFGKKVVSVDEQKEFYQAKIEELTTQLAEAKLRLEDAEKREADYKDKVAFAKKVESSLAEYKRVFVDLKKLIDESIKSDVGKEEEIKTKIKDNRWILGLECFVEAKNQQVDNQTHIDLHVKTKYEQNRIFEVKSPNKKPFVRKDKEEKRRLVLSPELADGLSELILYLRRTDLHSNDKNKGNYGVQKASGYILIGKNLDNDEKEMITELNFHLYPHIQIMTYDDLIKNTERELEIIEGLKKNE
jgi:hypothetical protein